MSDMLASMPALLAPVIPDERKGIDPDHYTKELHFFDRLDRVAEGAELLTSYYPRCDQLKLNGRVPLEVRSAHTPCEALTPLVLDPQPKPPLPLIWMGAQLPSAAAFAFTISVRLQAAAFIPPPPPPLPHTPASLPFIERYGRDALRVVTVGPASRTDWNTLPRTHLR